jgi:hypothetical protein
VTVVSNASTQHNAAVEARCEPAACDRTLVRSGTAPVNEFEMSYEMHNTVTGKRLLTLHPACGIAHRFPSLVRNRHRIAVAHRGQGRSTDSDRPLTDAPQADDLTARLAYRQIEQVSSIGACVGSAVALNLLAGGGHECADQDAPRRG